MSMEHKNSGPFWILFVHIIFPLVQMEFFVSRNWFPSFLIIAIFHFHPSILMFLNQLLQWLRNIWNYTVHISIACFCSIFFSHITHSITKFCFWTLRLMLAKTFSVDHEKAWNSKCFSFFCVVFFLLSTFLPHSLTLFACIVCA